MSGETAKLLSERFSKTFQDRESISINSNDTSISHSKQLEQSVPSSTISSLSSGEFVGIIADNPDQPIELKAFHSRIIIDHSALKKEKENLVPIPIINEIDPKDINNIYLLIKREALDIIEEVMENVLNDPAMQHALVKKGK